MPQGLPIELPSPSHTSLDNEPALNAYLSTVAVTVQNRTGAELVGIYLVDPVTSRLAIRAWTERGHAFAWGEAEIPVDLGRRGIDGEELCAATLRDYMHAGPHGERIAMPVHDGTSWIGAIVGLAPEPFANDAPSVFHDTAAQLTAVLKKTTMPIGDQVIEESEESLELPSDAILGHPAGGGIAAGPALRLRSTVEHIAREKVEETTEQALTRFDAALEQTRMEIDDLLSDATNELYDVVSLIFSAHLMMLTDEAFSGAIRSLIEGGQTPEDAVQSVVASFVRTFRGLRETRLAEKAQDVRDIGMRLLTNLAGGSPPTEPVSGHIAVVHDVLPSDLVRLAVEHASGIVILGSAVTAHIAILAQSLRLPTLMTNDRRALEIATRTPLLLDAEAGKLLISPTAEQLLDHGIGTAPSSTAGRVFSAAPARACADAAPKPATAQPVPAEPESALAVRLYANVNLLSDARRGASLRADGIGLYRSEFPFIIRNDYISEEEQYRVYRTIVRTMPGKPIVLRTADIGGDKLLAGREEERNPFLGVRGIRFSLANRPLFRQQLRAMLRAGHDADLHLMFPMVSSTEEIEDAREELERCMDELEREGLQHHSSPKVGAMVELPSAVVSIEEFADATDFLSIGTNDLIMYLLAVDRTNERLSELYRSHHPVVLRTIAEVARRVGSRIANLSVCGESAADPAMIPFYLGIGIRKLSVSPRFFNQVRTVLSECTPECATEYAEEILAIRSLREMDRFLTERQKASASVNVPQAG